MDESSSVLTLNEKLDLLVSQGRLVNEVRALEETIQKQLSLNSEAFLDTNEQVCAEVLLRTITRPSTINACTMLGLQTYMLHAYKQRLEQERVKTLNKIAANN